MRNPAANRLAVEPRRCKPGLECRPDRARRKVDEWTRHGVDAVRRIGLRPCGVAAADNGIDIAVGESARHRPVVVSGQRPRPFLHIAVECQAAVQRVGRYVASERLKDQRARNACQRCRRQSKERCAGIALPTRIDGSRDGVSELAVENAVQLKRIGCGGECTILPRIGERKDGRALDDAAIAFQYACGVVVFGAERQPPVLADVDHLGLEFGRGALARRRCPVFPTERDRTEIVLQDEIDHTLIGGIAILQRDFLGQDLHALDGFGRQVAQFAES